MLFKNYNNMLKIYVIDQKYTGKELSMTIIGIYKYLDSESTECSYLLKVESWGKLYYINYSDQYADRMDYTSNVLLIQ